MGFGVWGLGFGVWGLGFGPGSSGDSWTSRVGTPWFGGSVLLFEDLFTRRIPSGAVVTPFLAAVRLREASLGTQIGGC